MLAEEYARVVGEYTDKNMTAQSLLTLDELVSSYPEVGSALEEAIRLDAADMTSAEVLSYDAATGTVVITASADAPQKFHAFAEKLQEDDRFTDVEYNGYDRNGSGVWSAEITVVLRGEDEHESELDGER